MKRGHSAKALCLFFALIFGLSAFVFSGTAAEGALKTTAATITAVSSSDNDNITASNGYDHGYVPNINVFQNPDNSYAVCVSQANDTLKIIETNGVQVANEITVGKELYEYSAFTKGTDGTYYVLFSNLIDDKDGSKTALRLVNYSKDGEKIRSLDMTGHASGHFEGIAKLDCGNNALSENGNFVTGHVGRLMFTASTQGLVHQASYSFAVSTKTFKQVEVENSTVIPYASHSFHQMILQDGSDFVYAERSDALPKRSFHLTKMSAGSSWKMLAKGDSYTFKGDFGYNDTFSQLGGIVKTSAGYLLVSSYQNTTDSTEPSAANLVTQLFDTATLASQPEKVLTSYSGIRAEGVTNPKALLINADTVIVPYMVSNQFTETKRMYVGILNAYGELTNSLSVDTDAVLPRFGQVMYNSDKNSVEWFSIEQGKLTMYSIDLSEVDFSQGTTVQPDNSTTSPEESSTNAPEQDTETTTQPSTQPPTEAPTQPGIFQQIVDFFVGIYNWLVSFFNSLFT